MFCSVLKKSSRTSPRQIPESDISCSLRLYFHYLSSVVARLLLTEQNLSGEYNTGLFQA